VPDFVVTFTAPDEVKSFERSKLDCASENSWMELAGMSSVVVPTVSSLTSTPSTSMRCQYGQIGRPNEMEEYPTFVGSKFAPSWSLHAWLELCQVEEVAAVDWQVFNLTRRQNALHRGLFGVDLNIAGLHLNYGAFLSDFQLYAAVGGIVYLYIQR